MLSTIIVETVLLRWLSPPRLEPYLDAAGIMQDAVRLYRWNVELFGAVYEPLNIFEVVLRNALDDQLCI